MEKLIYKASLDITSKIITAAAIALFVFLIYKSISVIITSNRDHSTLLVHIPIIVFSVASLLIPYLLMPLHYKVTGQSLIIKRHWNSVSIDLREVQEAKFHRNEGVTVRTWASGGLFGYFGKFHNNQLGDITYYATNPKNKILLIMGNNKKVIITPDDPDFLETLQESLGTEDNKSNTA